MVPQEFAAADQVSLWKETASAQNALTLKTGDEIEQYVLSLCRGYFRATRKAHLTLDSALSDHGLDSLDSIELII